MLEKNNLSNRIALISINPTGKFVKSAQFGFKELGLYPVLMIHVSTKKRFRNEFKKFRLGILKNFVIPKFFQHFGNNRAFNNESVDIKIQNIIKVKELNSDETLNLLKQYNIKYLINCGAGIFRSKIVNLPNLYIINAHAGKLPDFRNMNVVEWALMNNMPVVGTIHLIDNGIDTGAILYEEVLDLCLTKNIDLIKEQAFDLVIKLIGSVVINLEMGLIYPKPQSKLGKNWYRIHPLMLEELNSRVK
jgi:folate-dependent phosphoribosylglycinamide formyltransferase PurN